VQGRSRTCPRQSWVEPISKIQKKDATISDSVSKTSWKKIARWCTIAVVALAIAWTARQGWIDLSNQPLAWHTFAWQWVLVAVALYMLGMAPSWLFWHLMLQRFGLSTTWQESFQAFYASQLGKYVPGKVMVIAIRTAMICGKSTQNLLQDSQGSHLWIAVSATAVMETLTFIAVGGAIGAISGAYFFAEQWWVVPLATLIAFTIALPISPPIFRILVRRLPLARNSTAKTLMLEKWNWGTYLAGWLLMPLGWLLLGGSLFALFQCLPQEVVTSSDYPRALACVSLANVLGFVSLIPGGFGVREVIMYPILGERFTAAIVLVVLYRLASLSAEILAAGIGFLLNRISNPVDHDQPLEE